MVQRWKKTNKREEWKITSKLIKFTQVFLCDYYFLDGENWHSQTDLKSLMRSNVKFSDTIVSLLQNSLNTLSFISTHLLLFRSEDPCITNPFLIFFPHFGIFVTITASFSLNWLEDLHGPSKTLLSCKWGEKVTK